MNNLFRRLGIVVTTCIICYFIRSGMCYADSYVLLIAFVLLAIFGQLCVWEGRWIQSVLTEKEPLG